MRVHNCPSGWHRIPSRACYIGHGCRCDRCRWHEAAYYAARNGLPTPDAPSDTVDIEIPVDLWADLRTALENRGQTLGDALRQLAAGDAVDA